jgi:hypothetical protein
MSFSIYTNQNGDIQLPNLTISSDLRFNGNNQVRIAEGAGNNNQGNLSIAVGAFSGNLNQGDEAIAIGVDAGNSGQGTQSIAIGLEAGETLQNINTIALGYRAGRNTQGQFGISIGSNAGETQQQDGGIAIGGGAGNVNQGVDSIALGSGAGTLNQEDNTIIINSTGVALNGIVGVNNALYVAPIRNLEGESTLRYNNTTKEITYSNNPYGELINTTTIPIAQNAETVMPYNSLEIGLNVDFDALNPSRIIFDEAGIYKVGTSIQFTKLGGGAVEVDIWFRKNGNDIPNSASAVEITGGANSRNFAYVEIMEQLNVNDYLEIVCGTTSADVSALSAVALVAPPFNRPAIPSIITTVYKISE